MTDTDNGKRSGDEQLFSKKASFIQHSLPGLEAGSYQISVQQAFKDNKGNPVTTGELATITRQFGVQGPRYSLPGDAVHSVFPPASSAGGFSNSVAHVVLEQEKLPWIRTPYCPAEPPVKSELCNQFRHVIYITTATTRQQLAVLLVTIPISAGNRVSSWFRVFQACFPTIEDEQSKGRFGPGSLPPTLLLLLQSGRAGPEGRHCRWASATPQTRPHLSSAAALFVKLVPSMTTWK